MSIEPKQRVFTMMGVQCEAITIWLTILYKNV